MPWLEKSPPLPAPPPPSVAGVKDSVSDSDWGENSTSKFLSPSGWVCDLTVPAKATTPCVVSMLLCQGHVVTANDGSIIGAPPPGCQPVATQIANITRAGVVNVGCPTVHAGFAFELLKTAVVRDRERFHQPRFHLLSLFGRFFGAHLRLAKSERTAGGGQAFGDV